MAVFVRVVETESFSEAARQLGATPSSVSRSIARLEQALGAQLLQRTTRKLGLTQSGSDILQSCRDIVDAARTVMELSLNQAQDPAGLIRISAPNAVGRTLIHPHVADFLREHPRVDVQLIFDDRPLDLVEHNIDLALRITDSPPVGLRGRQLMDIDHVICASPSYLATCQAPSHPKDLAAHACITLGENPSDARWKFVKDGASTTVAVKGRYLANHTGARLDATLNGVGIGSLPAFTAAAELGAGRIVRLLPEWKFVTHYTGALWLLYLPTRYTSSKLRVFIDHLAQRLRTTPRN